jgi:hypothetical protein
MKLNVGYQIFVNGKAIKTRFGNRKAAGQRFDRLRASAQKAGAPVEIELVSTGQRGQLVLRGYKNGGVK